MTGKVFELEFVKANFLNNKTVFILLHICFLIRLCLPLALEGNTVCLPKLFTLPTCLKASPKQRVISAPLTGTQECKTRVINCLPKVVASPSSFQCCFRASAEAEALIFFRSSASLVGLFCLPSLFPSSPGPSLFFPGHLIFPNINLETHILHFWRFCLFACFNC